MRAQAIVVAFLACSGAAFAHRLDEYLQATTVGLEKDRIEVEMRLSPGVAVVPIVLAAIDRNADGVISESEESAYAQHVLGDVSLRLDGEAIALRLTSKRFARVQDLREGMGEIRLQFAGDVSARSSPHRELQFENRHQKQIGVYLVNALLPRDPDVQVVKQSRNYEQSSYVLDYAQAGSSGQRAWLLAVVLLVTMRLGFLWWRGSSRDTTA